MEDDLAVVPGVAFMVTAASQRVELEAPRPVPGGTPGGGPRQPAFTGQAAFTVTNTTSRTLRGRVVVIPDPPADATWFSIVRQEERIFPPGATEHVTVQIAIPPGTTSGPRAFAIGAVGVENPDEDFARGPGVAFDVPVSTAPRKPFPWWIGAIVAVVLIGGFVVFRVMAGNDDQMGATNPILSLILPCADPESGQLGVVGQGFAPGFVVELRIEEMVVGMVDPDGDGRFSTTVMIPLEGGFPITTEVVARQTQPGGDVLVTRSQGFRLPCIE